MGLSRGIIDLLAWALGQTGTCGRVTQLSCAYVFEGGFQPAILPSLKPWVRGGVYAGIR